MMRNNIFKEETVMIKSIMRTGHFRMLIFILKMLFLYAESHNAIKINLAYPSTKNYTSFDNKAQTSKMSFL